MARNNGRWGRLRRVLNEDLSTSTVIYGGADVDRTPGDTPRYGAGANIENHPQVTDYVPRRFSILGLVLAGGAGLGIIAETLAHNADALSSMLGVTPTELTATMTDRLVGWTSAIALVVAAAYARVIYILKRHRLDDLRGRYRVWHHASLLAIVLSANCVIALHSLLAHAAGHITGFHPLGGDAAWWLVPTALVAGWIFARLIRDAVECRTALIMFAFSAASFIIAAICAAGWSPIGSTLWADTLTRSLPLIGCLCALAGTMLTARYVVLDVQGLIEHEVEQAKPASDVKSSSRNIGTTTSHSSAEDAQEVAWTDGSEPEDDYSDDDRPLSKADRKRLRKGRFRAA